METCLYCHVKIRFYQYVDLHPDLNFCSAEHRDKYLIDETNRLNPKPRLKNKRNKNRSVVV